MEVINSILFQKKKEEIPPGPVLPPFATKQSRLPSTFVKDVLSTSLPNYHVQLPDHIVERLDTGYGNNVNTVVQLVNIPRTSMRTLTGKEGSFRPGYGLLGNIFFF